MKKEGWRVHLFFVVMIINVYINIQKAAFDRTGLRKDDFLIRKKQKITKIHRCVKIDKILAGFIGSLTLKNSLIYLDIVNLLL